MHFHKNISNDYVPNNIRANNMKTKRFPFNIKVQLVSFNLKNKSKYPVKQSNSRTFICNSHSFFSESLLQSLSVMGSQSVARNKTHAKNVASEGSQNLNYKVYYKNLQTTRASELLFGIKHFK